MHMAGHARDNDPVGRGGGGFFIVYFDLGRVSSDLNGADSGRTMKGEPSNSIALEHCAKSLGMRRFAPRGDVEHCLVRIFRWDMDHGAAREHHSAAGDDGGKWAARGTRWRAAIRPIWY